MATNMNVSLNYGSHLASLIKAFGKTTGDVLELGMGVFSTPYLHYACILSNRHLVSYENYKEWMGFFLKYNYPCENHEINFVEKYADAKIDRPWDVVLVDMTPDDERIKAVRRLANLTKYIIIHDSSDKDERVYHYSEIYPLFKYRADWVKDKNHATILSNFVDLKDFWL